MRTACIIGVLITALAARQDPPPETADDLDRQARTALQQSAVAAKGLDLPTLFFMNREIDIVLYVDPVAVPKIEDVTATFIDEAPLDEILERMLKAKGLVHLVWQGVVLITDDKGRKAFQDADWTGLSQKGLKDHPELAKKMTTAFTFKWDAYEPREALKEFAKVSGVAIKTDALAKFEVKREPRGMISPDRTTLWGALVCLARTTGITYGIAKDGSLVAKPPTKK